MSTWMRTHFSGNLATSNSPPPAQQLKNAKQMRKLRLQQRRENRKNLLFRKCLVQKIRHNQRKSLRLQPSSPRQRRAQRRSRKRRGKSGERAGPMQRARTLRQASPAFYHHLVDDSLHLCSSWWLQRSRSPASSSKIHVRPALIGMGSLGASQIPASNLEAKGLHYPSRISPAHSKVDRIKSPGISEQLAAGHFNEIHLSLEWLPQQIFGRSICQKGSTCCQAESSICRQVDCVKFTLWRIFFQDAAELWIDCKLYTTHRAQTPSITVNGILPVGCN